MDANEIERPMSWSFALLCPGAHWILEIEGILFGMKPVNRCRSCGAASYKPVISRDEAGGMRPSGQYRCVGCNLVFNSIDEWRTGIDSQGLSLSAFNGRPLHAASTSLASGSTKAEY
jgi:hypothetical protein